MTSKVFTRLFGIFLLLLVLQTLVMEIVFHSFAGHAEPATLHTIGREAFWSGLLALAIALAVSAWVAGRLSRRIQGSSNFPAASPGATSPHAFPSAAKTNSPPSNRH